MSADFDFFSVVYLAAIVLIATCIWLSYVGWHVIHYLHYMHWSERRRNGHV